MMYRPETVTDNDTDINPNISNHELLQQMADSLVKIERRDASVRQVLLTTLPTVPIMSTSVTGPADTTINQQWTIPQTFRVKYYVIASDTACWFTLRNGPRADGPYRAINGMQVVQLEDVILGGSNLQIEAISSGPTIVRLWIIGSYVE